MPLCNVFSGLAKKVYGIDTEKKNHVVAYKCYELKMSAIRLAH